RARRRCGLLRARWRRTAHPPCLRPPGGNRTPELRRARRAPGDRTPGAARRGTVPVGRRASRERSRAPAPAVLPAPWPPRRPRRRTRTAARQARRARRPGSALRRRSRSPSPVARHLPLDPRRVLLVGLRLRRQLNDALLAVKWVLPPDVDVGADHLDDVVTG